MTFRFKGSLCLVWILCSGLLFADPLLWKASKGPRTIYLLGSIHLANQSLYPLPDKLLEAILQSDAVVLELDESVQSSDTMQLLLQQAQLPKGQSLQSMVSPSTWKALVDNANRYGLPLDLLQHSQPWFAAQQLSLRVFIAHGLNPMFGVDLYIMSLAKEHQIPILGLETIQQQLDKLVQLGEQDADQYLQQQLDDINQAETLITDLMVAWKAGNADRIVELIHLDDPEFQAQYDLLLTQRNREWITTLNTYNQQYPTLFVVAGMAHMLGQDSVVHLLKQQDYSVQEVH